MYKLLKNALRSLMPNKVLFLLEVPLRKVVSLFYRGSEYFCPICDSHLKTFIEQGNERVCPACGSLERTRFLWELLRKYDLKDGVSILDFSPSRSFYRKMKSSKQFKYIASDLSEDFIADEKFDITKIELESGSIDIIICLHVLEHVLDDRKAMGELYRVLKPDGVCIVQTPYKEGDIYENYSIITSEDRLKHFGQQDHVRIYSVNGLCQRLRDVGFSCQIVAQKEVISAQIGGNELMIRCHKIT